MSPVRDHIPLEQGLRLTQMDNIRSGDFRQRPYSIRTRIKTCEEDVRIPLPPVRDHIPLEQGLRLCITLLRLCSERVRDHIPLEQGLRRLVCDYKALMEASETIFH